jgi:hypothetical protein
VELEARMDTERGVLLEPALPREHIERAALCGRVSRRRAVLPLPSRPAAPFCHLRPVIVAGTPDLPTE